MAFRTTGMVRVRRAGGRGNCGRPIKTMVRTTARARLRSRHWHFGAVTTESGQGSPAPAEKADELGNRFVSGTVMRCPAQPARAAMERLLPDLPFHLDGRPQ